MRHSGKVRSAPSKINACQLPEASLIPSAFEALWPVRMMRPKTGSMGRLLGAVFIFGMSFLPLRLRERTGLEGTVELRRATIVSGLVQSFGLGLLYMDLLIRRVGARWVWPVTPCLRRSADTNPTK